MTTTFDMVQVDLIDPSEANPRKVLTGIDELKGSIIKSGMVQPLLLRPKGTDKFEVVAGHRRVEAIRQLREENSRYRDKFSTVRAVVEDLSDQQALAVGLIENLNRVDLNPLELSETILRLTQEHNISADIVAKYTGKSKSWVMKTSKIVKDCSDLTKNFIMEGLVGYSAAMELSTLTKGKQDAIIEKIAKAGEDLSWKDIKSEAKKADKKHPKNDIDSIDPDEEPEETKSPPKPVSEHAPSEPDPYDDDDDDDGPIDPVGESLEDAIYVEDRILAFLVETGESLKEYKGAEKKRVKALMSIMDWCLGKIDTDPIEIMLKVK